MTTKTKSIISTIVMAVPALVLVMGGTMKIIGKEPQTVMGFLTEAGFGPCIQVLGLTELIIAGLLFYPSTKKPGFLLAICYFSGAFSLEISGGVFPASTIFIALLWIGMFLKDKKMFLGNEDLKV